MEGVAYGPAVDVYSFAVTLLLIGVHAFRDEHYDGFSSNFVADQFQTKGRLVATTGPSPRLPARANVRTS